MRLYRFLNSERGVQAIRERRLRISRLLELNDEFEFVSLALDRRADRRAIREMRAHMHERTGIICMSKRWSNPLLWGHYADSYRGMALEFEVLPQAFYKVEYVKERPTLTDFGCSVLDDITPEHIKRLTCMKFEAWSYEEEYRVFRTLGEPDAQGNHFVPFSENIRLTSVIVGPRTKSSRADVSSAIGDLQSVKTFQARAGFKKFEVVENRDSRRWR